MTTDLSAPVDTDRFLKYKVQKRFKRQGNRLSKIF